MGEALLAEVLAVLALVHHRLGQRWLWGHLCEHCLQDGTLMPLSGRQHDGDAHACLAAAHLDWGGHAPPRAPQSLCVLSTVFFHAPVAC